MDTKWKNSKFFLAIVAGIVAALIFMSFLPFFARRAEESYADPLTQQSFIEKLLQANYAQYKYLREKADQKQYDYNELYLTMEREGEAPVVPRTAGGEDTVLEDELANDNLQNLISRQTDSLSYQLEQYEQLAAALGDRMDYYVQDLDSGVTLSNSGNSLPDAVAADQAGEDKSSSGEYIYYVSLQYDSAGNISNVYVRCQDNAKQFMNRVQTAGHLPYITLDGTDTDYYDTNGQTASYPIYDSYDEVAETVWFQMSSPKNMRVIYGLTQTQYASLLQLDGSEDSYDSSSQEADLYLIEELHAAQLLSYQNAGIGPVYFLILLLCGLFGIFAGMPRKKETAPFNGTEHAHTEETQGIFGKVYVEISIIGAIILFAVVDRVIEYVYEYQNGLFLQNIRAAFGGDGRLLFIPVDKAILFGFFFLLFFAACFIGLCLSGIRRGNLKERSFFCKYWRKIYTKIKSLCVGFYDSLVSYDIGTEANSIIIKVLGVNFVILLCICCFWFAGIFGLIVYTIIVYFILKKYVMDIQDKYRKLLGATRSIAQGNLDTALSENFGVFESYKSELWQIQADFKRAVEEEVKSQRMKSELITNVSHDLKTPLTAIITYIDLLKEPGVTEEKQKEYLAILQKKANRLKVLIEDLFEISKASSKTVTLQIVDVDICNLLRQAYLEQEDRITAARLDFKFQLSAPRILLPLDSQKTYRIFDNLYTNIIKYAMPGTRVYVLLQEKPDSVRIELKNISQAELSMDPNELTERFVRGDGSRNTEGSGLGLAIAKSFTELQGGSMHIELDGDLFKVILTFKKSHPFTENPGKHSEEGREHGTASGEPRPYNRSFTAEPQRFGAGPNPSAPNYGQPGWNRQPGSGQPGAASRPPYPNRGANIPYGQTRQGAQRGYPFQNYGGAGSYPPPGAYMQRNDYDLYGSMGNPPFPISPSGSNPKGQNPRRETTDAAFGEPGLSSKKPKERRTLWFRSKKRRQMEEKPINTEQERPDLSDEPKS